MEPGSRGFDELECEEVAEEGEKEEEGLVFGVVVLGQTDGFEQVCQVLDRGIMGLRVLGLLFNSLVYNFIEE